MKDKRKRARVAGKSYEAVPRESRPRRDNDSDGERRPYNPDFKKDNKPAFNKERRDDSSRDWSKDNGDRPAKRFNDNDGWNKDKGDRPRRDNNDGERRSYNPNFTKDNKPAFNKERRDDDRKDWNRDRSDRPAKRFSDDDKWNRTDYKPERKEYGDRDQNRDRKPFRRDDDRGEKRFSRDSRDGKSGPGRPAGAGKYGSKPGGKQKFDKKKDFTPKSYGDDYPKFPAPKIEKEMRLNRYIAMSGASSRREADEFITSGLVSVNGVVATELGTKVKPGDEVRLNDKVLRGEKKVYVVMNKPKGYVTSLEDPHADKTVMDLLENVVKERVYPVGRLDKNSLGVLLITNDGDLTTKLTHPSYSKKKIYQVSLDRALTRADMDSIAKGITLEDGPIHADEISYVKDNKKEVGIEIHSGRNRIVRRIFEHLGYNVTKLDRVYFAGLTKKNLTRGAWRFLSPREVDMLMSGKYE